MKMLQSTLEESCNAVDALQFLRDTMVITQRDFWVLTGNYVVPTSSTERNRTFFTTMEVPQ